MLDIKSNVLEFYNFYNVSFAKEHEFDFYYERMVARRTCRVSSILIDD